MSAKGHEDEQGLEPTSRVMGFQGLSLSNYARCYWIGQQEHHVGYVLGFGLLVLARRPCRYVWVLQSIARGIDLQSGKSARGCSCLGAGVQECITADSLHTQTGGRHGQPAGP